MPLAHLFSHPLQLKGNRAVATDIEENSFLVGVTVAALAQLRSLAAPATGANGELLEVEGDEGDVGDDADEEVDGAEADLNEETLPLKLRLKRAISALRRMASQTGLTGPAGERR
jgi:hypothetical protein